MTWLTPKVLRAMTLALFVVAFGVSSLTLSGSSPRAQAGSPAVAQHH